MEVNVLPPSSEFPLSTYQGKFARFMLETNVSLSQFSNYRIGGSAHYFFIARGLEDIYKSVTLAQIYKWPVFILGGGTNLLINDEGFGGLVLKINLNFISQNDNLVTVGAGVSMDDLLNFCIERGLSGLEWAGGLPGTVGGAVRGNAGAFKGEIKDSINKVVSLKYKEVSLPYIVSRGGAECDFGYRTSVFKKYDGEEIILTATFNLRPGNKATIRQSIEEKVRWRQSRQPLDYPNIGSIFKNVAWELVPKYLQDSDDFKKHLKTDPFPVLPTATLIDKAGLKGVSFGGAMISPKHPNFIVNLGTANATDVRNLVDLVKAAVKEKFEVNLEEEIIYV